MVDSAAILLQLPLQLEVGLLGPRPLRVGCLESWIHLFLPPPPQDCHRNLASVFLSENHWVLLPLLPVNPNDLNTRAWREDKLFYNPS